jgi:hypothetical protein
MDFQGHYESSPSGTWHIAVETAKAGRPIARWALIRDIAVRSSGSAETHQVLVMAVADDATFVLARRTGKVETTIEVRESGGDLIVSNRVEAIANSCATTASGRWVAVGFIDAKRGDEPVVLLDADHGRVYRRIPARGGLVQSIDEDRRIIVTEDGEFEFGAEATGPVLSTPGSTPPPTGSWNPAAVYAPPVETGSSPWRALWWVLGGIAAVFIGYMLVVGVFVAGTPSAVRHVVKEMGKSAVDEYEMTRRHGSKEDICHAAGEVAEFYLRTHNEAQYSRWKAVEKKDCSK